MARYRTGFMSMGAAAIVFLAGIAGALVPAQAASPASPADASDRLLVMKGKNIYAKQCASCHGGRLQGQANWRRKLPDGGFPAPPHDASGHTWHHSDKLLFRITKDGGAASAPAGFKSNMPGFSGKLSDTDIWAVLAYIKSTWPPRVQMMQNRRNVADR